MYRIFNNNDKSAYCQNEPIELSYIYMIIQKLYTYNNYEI